ncbi:MAG TPA: CvpA family protein [Dehalococcoidia bacterium]|nr:CvpA family protein [Dehalococcoidia bacterium]
MNWLDIIVVLGMAWFAYSGFSSGILRESVTVAAIVGGAALAGLFYQELANDLEVFTGDNERTAAIVAFIIIFTSIALMGQFVASLLKAAASVMMLGWLDHLLGGLFGLAKGIVLAEVFFALFVTYPSWRVDDVISGSALAPFFLDTMRFLVNLLPGEFRAAVDSFLRIH